MITYYFDGFRGLEQTFVPLLDVNFLMGENSTGKTSVLSAIQVLCSKTFWYTGELRNEHIDLGSFQEVATKGRSIFHLGYYVESTAIQGQRALLVSFQAHDQKPELISTRLFLGDKGAHWTQGGLQRLYVENNTNSPPPYDGGPEHVYCEKYTSKELFDTWLKETSEMVDSHHAVRTKSTNIPAPLMVGGYLGRGIQSLRDPAWIAPIRAKPKRVYEAVGPEYSPEGDHTPYLLKRMLESAESPERAILQKFGLDSGLFKDVQVHRFGNDPLAPLTIEVDLGALRTSIFNVGYGISQALPILAEIISRADHSQFLIQQAEVHLHPKAQAALGSLFFEMSREPHKKQFLLETHSDFIVDRFRICMRKATDAGEKIPSAQVLFFERKGDKNVITPLIFEPRGEYPEDQPADFRDFCLQEELSNLGF